MCWKCLGSTRVIALLQSLVRIGSNNLTVQFDIDAREYNGRWYNDFRAYNVVRGQIPQPQTQQPIQVENPFPPFGELQEDNGGDLPF